MKPKQKQVLDYFRIKYHEVVLLRLIQNGDFSKQTQLQQFEKQFGRYVGIGGNHPSIISFAIKLKNQTLESILLQISAKGSRSTFFLTESEIQLFQELLSEYIENGGDNESIIKFSNQKGLKTSTPLTDFASSVEFLKYILWLIWDKLWLFNIVVLLLANIYFMVIVCLAKFGVDISRIFIFDLPN